MDVVHLPIDGASARIALRYRPLRGVRLLRRSRLKATRPRPSSARGVGCNVFESTGFMPSDSRRPCDLGNPGFSA